MFSPSVRVSFAIFLRRSGPSIWGGAFANVGLSGEKEMVLRLDVWGTAVMGDMDSVVERESVDDDDDETGWR
jgi:hypothetical protein